MNKRYTCFLCAALVLLPLCGLSGCKAAKPADSLLPAPTPTPLQTPEPVEETKQPVAVFYEEYQEAFAPLLAQIQQWQLDAQPERLSDLTKALLVEQYAQRLSLFFPTGRLSPVSENTWDGLLFGALDGTASIVGNEQGGYSFTCSLWSQGRILGQVLPYRMQAEWQTGRTIVSTPNPDAEGDPGPLTEWATVRTAKLWKFSEGYFALMQWDDGAPTALYSTQDALYYGSDYSVVPTGSHPLQWADWYFDASNHVFVINNTEIEGDLE